MSLLLLEALGALVLLVFIVWWTMFSGRKNGELISNKDENDKKDGIDERGDDRKAPTVDARDDTQPK